MPESNKIEKQKNDVILDSISDGVFTVNRQWKVTSFNKAAEIITGISKEEAIGEYCYDVFRSSMCEKNCALKKTIASGKPLINRSCYFINSSGEKVPISISTAVLYNENGNITGGVETFRDLREITALRHELQKKFKIGDMVSASSSMSDVFEMIPIVADSDSTLLIEGNTGTGKELLAKAVHYHGRRKDHPFIAVNCAALPDTLLESELFGYKKGAFTGADHDKKGRFALAEKGTLFLDEIGEISPALQIKLLRVLQEREYMPLGAENSTKTNLRIIAATNKNLQKMVELGHFRQDLFFRINVIKIHLPDLNDRMEDIPLLVDHFIHKFNQLQNKNVKGIDDTALAVLMSHNWQGNIRELENTIERAFVLCRNEFIKIKHLPQELQLQNSEDSLDYEKTMLKLEKNFLLEALQKNKYNRRETAKKLGIHPATLYRKIKRLGIK